MSYLAYLVCIISPTIFISSIILTLFYLAYKLFCSPQKQPEINRATILLMLIVSLSAWPIYHHFSTGATQVATETLEQLVPTENYKIEYTRGVRHIHHNIPRLFLSIYYLGLIFFFIRWSFSFLHLFIIRCKSKVTVIGGRKVYISPDNRISPFSIFGMIVLPVKDLDEAEMIVEHEKIHVARHHSLDLTFARLVATFQWFNPAAWLMIRELKAVHEFEADAGVIDTGIDMKQYQLLLIKKAVGKRFPSPANSLSHSNLKKRISMMQSSQATGFRRFGALLMIPAVAFGLAISNHPAIAATIQDLQSTSYGYTNSADNGSNSSATAKVQATVFTAVEKMPQFPGGERAMLQCVAENIRYPHEAAEANIQGRVVVKFVVKADGSIGDVVVLRSVDPQLDAEAVRVVKSLPRFIPGEMGGKPVDVWYTLPLNFRLSDDSTPQGEEVTEPITSTSEL